MEIISLRRVTKSFPRISGLFNTEEPLYYVLERKGNREIRDYKSYLSVYTEVSGMTYEDAITLGFWKLHDYFLFNNLGERDLSGNAAGMDSAVKMELTSPVFETNVGLTWKVSMMIPSTYSMTTVPLPIDPAVHIVQVPEKVVAVVKSKGMMTIEKIEKQTERLEDWIRELGHFTMSSMPYIAHHDLFPTFQFLRRTEIHIQVEKHK